MRRETKSPIKNLPVHVPGHSIREQIERVWDTKILEPSLYALVFCMLAFMEWARFYTNTRPNPKLYTAVAGLSIIWAFFRIRKAIRDIKHLKLGLLGERAVGQYLEEKLSPLGYHILHDIPGEGFNIDHVVIGPTGIFCIETKTRSKPKTGQSRVDYDGEMIKVNGMPPERDPIVQVRSTANWLQGTLESTTGKKFTIQPIIVFPGWYVDSHHENKEVWVLNEKVVPSFVQKHRERLAPEDIFLVLHHLKRYVIVSEQK